MCRAGIMTPTLETHSMLVGGVPYSDLPIVQIKSTSNNTIINLTNSKGNNYALHKNFAL